MAHEQKAVQRLYSKLLGLYPRAFRECLAESMQQTFDDLYNERKQQSQGGVFGFVLWIFLETAVGICKEHLILVSSEGIMQGILKTSGTSALISFLLILPFMIMEVVNRRNFNEDFPFMLFFFMWLNLFAFSLILLPIARSRRAEERDSANPVATSKNTFLTNPRATLAVSIVLFLCPVALFLLESLGWGEFFNRLFNGPNPEQVYVPGLFISLFFFSLPVTAGVIASQPIINTLRAEGSLFAYPIHLIIVVVISFLLAAGTASLIIDQWPCFIGVPVCD